MPVFDCVQGVGIPEIVCALPAQSCTLTEYAPNLLNDKSAARMAKSTGFTNLRITSEGMTTADLFAAAAEKLLATRKRQEIAGLVFVTQTPDYVLPATSHTLQHRLGLSSETICLDINEGCSGFVTGLYVAACLAERLNAPVLLGAGDTISKLTSPEDRATRCIFGDEAAAVLVEPGEQDIPFAFASYGDRQEVIITENSRHRITNSPKNGGYLYLDGVEILNFSLTEVPEVINAFMSRNGLTHDAITLYACHQANKLILDSLADKLGVPREKMPFTSGDIGNESSASIPSVISRGGGGAQREMYCAAASALVFLWACASRISRAQKLVRCSSHEQSSL